jgi:glutamate dehydrogenase (NADP+)
MFPQSVDARVGACVSGIYKEVVATAKEFNTRGDLNAGANIAGFLRVADVMLAHGAV